MSKVIGLQALISFAPEDSGPNCLTLYLAIIELLYSRKYKDPYLLLDLQI